jgi:DNA-binding response OmpR family regulator
MSDSHAAAPTEAEVSTHSVVVYSDDAAVRDQVRTALGRRPAPDLGRVEWVECSTGEQVIQAVDEGEVDLVVLDGEAWPTGGLGLAKQMKDELRDCPPVLVLIARRPDAWLATWSQADGVVPHPIDAPELIAVATDLLRRREAGEPVRRALH